MARNDDTVLMREGGKGGFVCIRQTFGGLYRQTGAGGDERVGGKGASPELISCWHASEGGNKERFFRGGEKERRTFPKVESQYVGCFQIGPERVRWALGKYWAYYYYLFYFGSSSECNLQIVVSDDVDLLALASPK